jgi:class 3 adenylate cyclase/tetratricopeptide (TPR) repeat protein
MLALYRAGRQADALEAYQQTRRLLGDELGIEPSTELQRLERSILVHDPALEGPPAAVAAPAEPAPPPRRVRKLMTLLFAELEPAAEIDPETLSILLDEGRAKAAEILGRFGATVEELATGGVMAVFGIPAVHEDDAQRAVRAAVELRAAVGDALAVRVGIATGEALSGGAGRTVVGDVVPAAARLAQAAPAGEVLLAESTQRLVHDGAHVEVAAGGSFRLLDVVAGAEAIPRRLDTELLGRDRELVALRHALDRAVLERTAYLFTVLGPAGIGKSRLAHEFASSLAGEATVVRGGCLPYGDGITFWPLAQIVRSLVSDGDVRASLAELLGGGDEAELVADRVAGAIGAVGTPTEGEELFWAVRRLFEAVARERPLVVVFEDLHWAEATLLDLVEHIADWTRDASIVLLCLARPELFDERPAWGGGKLNATSILLEPLSRSEAETLIGNLPGAAQLDDAVRARIADAAEGNPLFLEQMLAMVAEEGGDSPLHVPATIQALLAARLDRLVPEERALLERASVIGNEFWRDAVVELSPPAERADVARRLQQLMRRELVRPSRSVFAGDEAFRFRHLLIRDAAYDSLPKAARGELHERFANWVESRAAERETELEEIVGYHLEQAHRYGAELGQADPALAARASERLARAGRRAYARGDIPAATTLLSRATALLADDSVERAELLVDLADALRESGDFREAEAALAEVRDGAGAGNSVLRAHALVVGLRLRLQVDPTISTGELEREATRAVEIFEERGDHQRLAKAWELLAWSLWFRCRAADAETALGRAVEHARLAGDSRTEAQSVNLLMGAAFFGPRRAEDAIRLCREVLATAEQPRIVASALRALAGLEAMRGDFDDARALVARYRSILDDLGLTVTAATASETSALVELLAGEPAAAERDLRRGFASLERMGETFNQPNLAAMLAHALHAQGRADEALRFSEISERTTGAEDVFTQAQWRSARAKVLVHFGRLTEAEGLARAAVAAAETTDFLVLRADSLADLAEVLAAAGRPDEAATALREAVELYDAKGNIVSRNRATVALERLGAS